MSKKFQAALQRRDGVSHVAIAGIIDEDNELAALVDQIPPGAVRIDLGQVRRINSLGVRDWVEWVKRLEAKHVQVVLVACSPAVIAQLNMIFGFAGQGAVESFYIPYVCPSCDVDRTLLVAVAALGPPPHEPPPCTCDQCGQAMEFDDVAASYFMFLSQPRRAPR